jgi:hypothetical protein
MQLKLLPATSNNWLPNCYSSGSFMWTHLLEALLAGAGILLGPLMVVAAMGGALALLDRYFHPSR